MAESGAAEPRLTAAGLIAASRPFSWVNTAYVFAAGAQLGGGWNRRVLTGTLYFTLPFNLALYGLNDLFDYASDMLNPRKNSIEGAIVRPSGAHTLLTAIAATNLPFLAYLFGTSNPRAAAALAFLLFTSVAYSAPPLRWKEVPLLDAFTSATHFVTPLVFGLLYGGAGFTPWLELAAFTLWAMASQAFGAVQDIEPDRAGGIASIATFLGGRRTATFALALYAAAIALVLAASRSGGYLLVAAVLALYPLNVLPYLRRPSAEAAHRGWRRFLKLNIASGAAVTRAFYLAR